MLEPMGASGSFRPTSEPMETDVLPYFPPVSYRIRNFSKLIALLLDCFHADSSLGLFIELMVEAKFSSETSGYFQQTTRRYKPRKFFLLTCIHAVFMLDLLFHSGDGGEIFFQNVSSLLTILHNH
jgi:hypothetical protein